MTPKVFLSLSYVDGALVKKVRSRLPAGLSYFYEQSFDNGEILIRAMERAVSDAAIFVLFASKQATESPWVKFEIDLARAKQITNPNHRIFIFPTDPDVSRADLPAWLRAYWIPQAGFGAADVARYITTVLLEPDIGLSPGAVHIVGRGKSLDKLAQLSADHLVRTKQQPNVIVLAGLQGIGRRTFASYYTRRALTADASLPYGPTLALSTQADLSDLYRALRNEMAMDVAPTKMAADLEAFQTLAVKDQLKEVNRLIAHFATLKQAVTLVSSGGFFEDRGTPKEWVGPLFSSVPAGTHLFVISSRHFQPDFVSNIRNLVQMHVDELDDKDIKTLMIFTAERLKVNNFVVSPDLIRAIGGHADVANAAVRLVALKGTHILNRDPRQLFNIQLTILGDNITENALSAAETRILNVLSWVPNLGGDLLESIVCAGGEVTADEFIKALENLVMACLVTAAGYIYSISSAIRQLFRRYHVTPKPLLRTFADILSQEWKAAERAGQFRADLFDAFVFMHVLEGKLLPTELTKLLPPGTLYEVVREAYARGKDHEDSEELERVISWGAIAEHMPMSEATRQEILSTVVRATIRLGRDDEAAELIETMGRRGYRSVLFLRGHMLRRQEKYLQAIPILEDATRERKYQRSAMHELALAYKKSGNSDKLRKLLEENGNLIQDSAMFADFQIGIDLARNDLPAAEAGIEHLARMPDDEGQSDIRRAQLLMRRQQYRPARQLLTRLLAEERKGRFRIRSLRAIAAAKDHDFELARRDIEFVKGVAGRRNAVRRLEAVLLTEQGKFREAESLLDQIRDKSSEDQFLYARIYELMADLAEIGLAERTTLREKAAEIRARYRLVLEYEDYED